MAIQQHPIPQQISSYQFRLVGDMTLKQFAKLAGGAIIAYLFYASGLPFILRFPLALFILLLGIGTAFFPFNERPLEFWIITFCRVAWSPTLYIWKKPFKPQAVDRLPEPNAALAVVSPFIQSPPPAPQKPFPVEPQEKRKKPSPPPKVKPDIDFKIEREKPKKVKSTLPSFLDIPLPAAPTSPNIITGVVFDTNGKIIEGAIVEIQDMESNPIRAMRTNSLGQFQTATPLPNGKYLVLVEKEPYHFDIIKIDATNKIIPPLQIGAKKSVFN